MANVAQADKNFLVDYSFDTTRLQIRNVLEKPFEVNGLILPQNEKETFRRIPAALGDTYTAGGVLIFQAATAGGRVRFKTNATSIAVFATMGKTFHLPHMADAATIGFDLYVDNRYAKSFVPPYQGVPSGEGFCGLAELHNNEWKEITIHFPLYSEVQALSVGVDQTAQVLSPNSYRYEKPVVFYGSSITQGACASRPGVAEQPLISRRLHCDFVNLGFSGGAEGETRMAEYIRTLPMQAFVCEYDHNAPTPAFLKDTLPPFIEIIRAAHPTLPIILASRPETNPSTDTYARIDVIRDFCEQARANGDNNIYFVNGTDAIATYASADATVDACHPNDCGFAALAKAVGDVLEKCL